MLNPKASQWNIGCVGSQMQIYRVGHVHLILLGVNFIRVGSHFFLVEYGLWSNAFQKRVEPNFPNTFPKALIRTLEQISVVTSV